MSRATRGSFNSTNERHEPKQEALLFPSVAKLQLNRIRGPRGKLASSVSLQLQSAVGFKMELQYIMG